ncbi:MAG: hypothetical protein Q7S03_02005 [bacterium]|nr:hypothetical protein [bacterium]
MATYLAQVDFKVLNSALSGKGFKFTNNTIGGVISDFLPFLFVFAGIILLLYLIWGGFILMTSGGDPKSINSGKGKITNALLGFLIIFLTYWLVQLLQAVFGLPTVF